MYRAIIPAIPKAVLSALGNDGVGGRVVLNGLAGYLPSYFTLTRASNGSYLNSAVTLTTATTDEARFDYVMSTLAPRGLVIEGARTNSCRNGNAANATAPSTLPTNWSYISSQAGITNTVVGTGTENGISGVYVRHQGTVTSVAAPVNIFMDTTTAITAASGQTWTGSYYTRVTAGSLGSATVKIRLSERTAAGSGLTANDMTVTVSGTLTRITGTATLSNASTGRLTFGPLITFPMSAVVDVTIFYGGCQLEQGGFASSYIATTSGAATRALDACSTTSVTTLGLNGAAWSVVVEFEANLPPSGVTSRIFQLDSGSDTAATRVAGTISNTGSVRLNGATTAATGGTYTSGVGKAAFVWTGSQLKCCVNGGAVVSASDSIASSFTRLRLGGSVAAGNELNGWLRIVKIYPTALSDGTMQGLTA